MTFEHIPTPSALSLYVDARLPNEINLMSGEIYVAYCVGHAGPDAKPENALDNARRLIACWNACQNISTESLEENGVASFEQVTELTKVVPAEQVAGYVLVPVEPTGEMLDHFCGTSFYDLSVSKQFSERKAYKAMLSAAPNQYAQPVKYSDIVSDGGMDPRDVKDGAP